MIISLYPVHGVTNSPTLALQKINAIVQMNRLKISGAEANSLEDGLPRCHHETVHKILHGLPKATGNHQPPTHTLSKMAKVWMFNCVTPQDILYMFSNEAHAFFLKKKSSQMLPTKLSQRDLAHP